MENSLSNKIEAILYFKGEPVSRKRLAEFLGVGMIDINNAIEKLKENLKNRGVVLVEKENEVMLGTASVFSDLIEKLQKEELSKDLSKASLETLSIILYKNGASRPLIDYIRGVNSNFTLRALSIRGLIERHIDETDSRRYIYKPTFELLSFMGVTRVEDLPEYEKVNNSITVAEEEEKHAQEELANEADEKSE